MDKEFLKVGELAQKSGISVRTLHHYDQIGLLSPSKRTESGHRLYSRKDIACLQQIVSMRCMGFSLNKIQEYMKKPDYSMLDIIRMHIIRIRENIQSQENIYSRLVSMEKSIRHLKDVTMEDFIKTIEVIMMSEQYRFTEKHMEMIQKQGETLGPEKIKQVEQEWPTLIARVRAEMDKGTPPEDPEVQKLATRWRELVEIFTGGDKGIVQTLKRRYDEQPNYAAQQGLDATIFEYIAKTGIWGKKECL